MTSLPSPFGSAKSGALSPILSDVRGWFEGGKTGGASGDCGACARAAVTEINRINIERSDFIAR